MPQVICKGIAPKIMEELAPQMFEKLSEAIGCPKDWLSIECVGTQFYNEDGTPNEHYPVIAIWWFERPTEVARRAADVLWQLLQEKGYPFAQITFHVFAKDTYFEFEQ